MKGLFLIGLSLVLTSSFASAQTSVRIRGTIAALDGNVFSVTDAGGKKVAIRK